MFENNKKKLVSPCLQGNIKLVRNQLKLVRKKNFTFIELNNTIVVLPLQNLLPNSLNLLA